MEKRSSRKRRLSEELGDGQSKFTKVGDSTYAGASLSKVNRNNTSQNMVYTVLMGNSAAVNNSGNNETWPDTARGRKAPKYRRSRSATKLKGMMTSKIAFS